MKKNVFLTFFLAAVVILSCNQPVKRESVQHDQPLPSTGTFGKQITADGAIPAQELPGMLETADTIRAKLSGYIETSCKHSGCWMDMDLGGEKVLKVTFLNDEFVIPKDAAGKTAIIEGYAYRELIPVEILKNYAAEQGKTQEEIAMITEPAWKYVFIAEGVIIE